MYSKVIFKKIIDGQVYVSNRFAPTGDIPSFEMR